MTAARQPAVTGLGLRTCLGHDEASLWRRLVAGESGIGPIRSFDAARCNTTAAGEIAEGLPREGQSRMAALFEGALAATLANAGLRAADLSARRTVVVVGSSFGAIFHAEGEPIELDQYVPGALARLGLNVPFLSVSSACSSGSDAIALGADLVEFGDYEVALCGGVDILDLYKMVGHSALGTLSPTGCRPFSANGDGTALGEGAAFFLLERCADARARGAQVRALLVGRAATTDTNTITSPDLTGAGAIRAIGATLARAGRAADAIAYVNAHGSGTPVNDAMEARVYQELFAARRPLLSSTKGAFGHTLGATGAIEAAVTVLALEHGCAPPTAHLVEVHDEWRSANLVRPGDEAATLQPGGLGLSVTYGFGGANVALLFELPRDERS